MEIIHIVIDDKVKPVNTLDQAKAFCESIKADQKSALESEAEGGYYSLKRAADLWRSIHVRLTQQGLAHLDSTKAARANFERLKKAYQALPIPSLTTR